MTDPETEFAGIFESMGGERPLMSYPPKVTASKQFIREVALALNITDDDRAREAADWIADKMERFGARSAQMVFDAEGSGPICSWCGIVWPLCGHHHQSAVLPKDEGETS